MTTTETQKLDRLLRDALRARAARLALDPASITSPTPDAITARGLDGSLLRLDYHRYDQRELSR